MKIDLFKHKEIIPYLKFIHKIRKKVGIGPKLARHLVATGSMITPSFGKVEHERIEGDGFVYEKISDKGSLPTAVFHIHGGAFSLGSVDTHRGMLNYIVKNSQCVVFAPEYPLSPEMRFPSQIESVYKAFKEVYNSNRDLKWVISGDSAGGNMAIVLTHQLLKEGISTSGLVLMSPWVNLTKESKAIHKEVDDLSGFDSEDVKTYISLYCDEEERENPRVSPILFKDFAAFPKTLIQVSKSELLYEDIIDFHNKLISFEVDSNLAEENDLFHSWQILPSYSAKARNSLDEVIEFVNSLE